LLKLWQTIAGQPSLPHFYRDSQGMETMHLRVEWDGQRNPP
jgi:hypothetical protein